MFTVHFLSSLGQSRVLLSPRDSPLQAVLMPAPGISTPNDNRGLSCLQTSCPFAQHSHRVCYSLPPVPPSSPSHCPKVWCCARKEQSTSVPCPHRAGPPAGFPQVNDGGQATPHQKQPFLQLFIHIWRRQSPCSHLHACWFPFLIRVMIFVIS